MVPVHNCLNLSSLQLDQHMVIVKAVLSAVVTFLADVEVPIFTCIAVKKRRLYSFFQAIVTHQPIAALFPHQ